MVTPLTLPRELQTVFTNQKGNQAENSQFLHNLNFFIEISIWPRDRKDFVSFTFLFSPLLTTFKTCTLSHISKGNLLLKQRHRNICNKYNTHFRQLILFRKVYHKNKFWKVNMSFWKKNMLRALFLLLYKSGSQWGQYTTSYFNVKPRYLGAILPF